MLVLSMVSLVITICLVMLLVWERLPNASYWGMLLALNILSLCAQLVLG